MFSLNVFHSKIPDLLKCQRPLSEKIGNNLVHDEYLFIIIHQSKYIVFLYLFICLNDYRYNITQLGLPSRLYIRSTFLNSGKTSCSNY